MTDKEIVNTDGSRNWQANILLDNLKRLEQENAELKAENARLKSCLQEIKEIAVDTRDCKQYEIDHDCFNETRCKALRELIETLQEILNLITKEESEEV